MLNRKSDSFSKEDALYDSGNYADGGEVKDDSGGSGIIDKIREYVMAKNGLGGGDVRDYQTAYNVDSSTGTDAGNYDLGGEIPGLGDDFDVNNMSGTLKTPAYLPPPPAPVPAMPATPSAPPLRALPASPPIAKPAIAQPSAPPVPPGQAAPAANTDVSSIIADAQRNGQALSGPYTPDKRAALYAALAAKQNGMGYAVGNTLAHVGDAIARGYGHSNSDYLNQSLASEAATRKEATDAFDKGADMNKEQTQAGMEIGKMDPTGIQSKIAQKAFAGPLSKMGYSQAQIAAMPASTIGAVVDTALKYADVQTQKELKDATLQLQAMQARASIANAQMERTQDAAKTVAAQGPVKTWLNGLFGNKGVETLENELPSGSQAPVTKTIGGNTYVQHNGQWYQQ